MRNYQLEVSHHRPTIREPKKSVAPGPPPIEMVSSSLPLVKDRGEWNQQTFIIRPKFEKKNYPSVDNQLEVEFPVHRNVNFVSNHSLGFKGKENVDLFKFYYRLYLKNKFAIQKIRKEKKKKDEEKIKLKQQQEQAQQQTDEPNTEEIRNACKTIDIRPPSEKKQLKFVRECIKNIKQAAAIVKKHVEFPKLTQSSVNIVNIDTSKIPQAKTLDQQYELEELMLSRVVQAIQESQSVSHDDVKLVREIIEKRQSQLSEMERQLQLNQLIGIKKQIYEREQILKNETIKPPGIDNPDNFVEFSSIQELSIIKAAPHRSQPNVSVVEYKFNNYENEEEVLPKNSILQKQAEESIIMQEQSTEMQSILQQVRSASLVAKETETSQERITDKTNDKNKLLPTLKFLEQAKQQIAQRSDNDSQLLQPYFQPEIPAETSKSKIQQSISMVSQLNSKNVNQSSSSKQHSHQNTLSMDKKSLDKKSVDKRQIDNKSGYREEQQITKPIQSVKELDQSNDLQFEGENYYEMKFTQILQRVIDKKKQQQGDDSQVNVSQSLSQVESEAVQKITQNLVANILYMHKNPSPVMDQPSTFNYLDIDSEDQEKVTESLPTLKNEDQLAMQKRLSYNRDISHLDHTFKIESQVSLSDKRLNEEQIANIIQQISQQLQQAKMAPSLIEKQLDDVTNILLKHPLNKLSQKLLRQQTITQNEPFKKIYLEETKYPMKPQKITKKEDIDYMKFYEENAPTKKDKSKKSQKLTDSNKRSIQNLKNMSEDERKQFLDSHKMNLQVRANEQEMDEELQFLQSVIGDQKKQREQIFKQRVSQPLESGKNTSREAIDFDENSDHPPNTFRSHNPVVNYADDQIKQGSTDINFNIRRPQIKQKTDQTSVKTDQFNTNSNATSYRTEQIPIKSKRINEDDPQFNLQQIEKSQKSSTQRSKDTQKKPSSKQVTQQQEVHSPNQSVEEVPHEDEQDKQSEEEEEFNDQEEQQEYIEQMDENGNMVAVGVTNRSQKSKTDKKTERSKQSKQSKQTKQSNQVQQKTDKTQPSQHEQQQNQQQQQQEEISSQQQVQIENEQPDREIKLKFQSSESNLINNSQADQSNTPYSQQQQIQQRGRIDLQNIQLKSYQPSQNQSPQLNTNTGNSNTPQQGPQQRKQGNKNTKFEEQKGTGNTPQARFQRVKTKLSKFQESANNDDEYDDYDWDEEDPSNKKKKITSKSSKSTLRNELQSPSISPMTKQQTEKAKKKIYDLKLEYELIARQNLSLSELKRDIEKKIVQLQNPDDEAKYNIYLFEQRQKQLRNLPHTIEGLVNDKRENEDPCGDVIRKFHENRMRYKDVIEKDQALKFTNQIQLDDEQQTQINTQSHLDEYMREVQMNIQRMIQQVQLEQMRDHPEVRKECFDFDTEIIQQRREDSLISEVRQQSAQMKIYEEPIQEMKKKTEFSEMDTVLSDQMDRKFELLARKLKNLKHKNPDKFNQIVNTEIVKQELYLQTTKHKYILD